MDNQGIQFVTAQNLATSASAVTSAAFNPQTQWIFMSATQDVWYTLDGSAPAAGSGTSIFMPAGKEYPIRAGYVSTCLSVKAIQANAAGVLTIVESR